MSVRAVFDATAPEKTTILFVPAEIQPSTMLRTLHQIGGWFFDEIGMLPRLSKLGFGILKQKKLSI